MTILRVQKSQNYVVMDKAFLANQALSWKAKGLLAYLLSLPDDWRINVKNLIGCAADGRDALQTALNELAKARFIVREATRNAEGRFRYEYTVFETPQVREKPKNPYVEPTSSATGFPDAGNAVTEKPATDFTATGNPHLLSIKNTKYKTKAAAVTTVVKENASGSEGKKESAAAFLGNLKFAETDYLIGNELSEPQKQAIQNAVDELMQDGIVMPTQQAFTHQQVAAMILSRSHFTKAGNEFCRKLNTITSQLRKGTLVLNRVNPVSTPVNPEHAGLEAELKKLCLAKYSEEQGMQQMAARLKDNPEQLASYTSAFNSSITDKAAKIEKVRMQLSEFKKNLLGA